MREAHATRHDVTPTARRQTRDNMPSGYYLFTSLRACTLLEHPLKDSISCKRHDWCAMACQGRVAWGTWAVVDARVAHEGVVVGRHAIDPT